MSPELQNALKVLSQYGLGVVDIHMHNHEGDIVPLQDGMVQLENDLQVSFIDCNNPKLTDATPVGWQWKNGGVQTTMYCSKNHGRCIIKS